MFILGLDVGYSNLKLSFGMQGSVPATMVFPSGAVPLSSLEPGVSITSLEGIQVDVDGDPYVCCVSPDRLESWTRVLHEDLPKSKVYKALFMAALSVVNQAEIDCLVVGVPVDQYFDNDNRQALKIALGGIHRNKDSDCLVKEVVIVPQPIGGYMELLATGGIDNIRQQLVLVVDPGFFSVDWVLVQDGQLRKQASGSSRMASSVVLEEACHLIAHDLGARVSRERLEHIIQKSGHMLPLRGQMVDISGQLQRAAQNVAPQALNEIMNSLRREKTDVDVVLVVGGGAEYYLEAVKSGLGRSMITVANDPVMANARGFWRFGEAQV